jgi:hypothetical protein
LAKPGDKPIFMKLYTLGAQAYYEVPALMGDQDYMKFWKRVQYDPQNTVFPSMKDSLQRLRETKSVLHVQQQVLDGFFKKNPFHLQHLKIFGEV